MGWYSRCRWSNYQLRDNPTLPTPKKAKTFWDHLLELKVKQIILKMLVKFREILISQFRVLIHNPPRKNNPKNQRKIKIRNRHLIWHWIRCQISWWDKIAILIRTSKTLQNNTKVIISIWLVWSSKYKRKNQEISWWLSIWRWQSHHRLHLCSIIKKLLIKWRIWDRVCIL